MDTNLKLYTSSRANFPGGKVRHYTTTPQAFESGDWVVENQAFLWTDQPVDMTRAHLAFALGFFLL